SVPRALYPLSLHDALPILPGTIRRQRFLGAVENPGAPVVLLGAPLDTTVSFRPGTRFGPSRIRDMSDGLEDYSPHLNLDFSQVRSEEHTSELQSRENLVCR